MTRRFLLEVVEPREVEPNLTQRDGARAAARAALYIFPSRSFPGRLDFEAARLDLVLTVSIHSESAAGIRSKAHDSKKIY